MGILWLAALPARLPARKHTCSLRVCVDPDLGESGQLTYLMRAGA
jgi:hypothetical protein